MADSQNQSIAQNIELQKLRFVIEQTPGAIFISDKEFRFEYVNAGYEKLSEYTKSEPLGKSVSSIFSQTNYTESREEIQRNMVAGEKWESEMQTCRKDRTTIYCKYYVSKKQLYEHLLIKSRTR